MLIPNHNWILHKAQDRVCSIFRVSSNRLIYSDKRAGKAHLLWLVKRWQIAELRHCVMQQCLSRGGPHNSEHTKDLWINWMVDAFKKRKKHIPPETAVDLSKTIFFSRTFWFHFNFLEKCDPPIPPSFPPSNSSVLVDCLDHVGLLCWYYLSILPALIYI